MFRRIAQAVRQGVGDEQPALVCEPGRAMVVESGVLALRVKAVGKGEIFLNDGLYGGLSEWRDMPPGGRVSVLCAKGRQRTGARAPHVVFGPTCDSLDQLPAPLPLPQDIAEGDYLVIRAMGAYSNAIATGFNGYGQAEIVMI